MMCSIKNEKLYRNTPWIVVAACALGTLVVYAFVPPLTLLPAFEATKSMVMEVECIVLPLWKRILLFPIAGLCLVPYLLHCLDPEAEGESSWENLGLIIGITLLWIALAAVPASAFRLEESILEQACSLSRDETSLLLGEQMAAALARHARGYRLALVSSDNLIAILSLCTAVHAVRERKRAKNMFTAISVALALTSFFFLTMMGDLLWSAIVVAAFWERMESGLFSHRLLTACLRREIPVVGFALLSLLVAAIGVEKSGKGRDVTAERTMQGRGRTVHRLLSALPFFLFLRRGFSFYKENTVCRLYADSIQSGLHLFTMEYTVPSAYAWDMLILFPCAAAVLYTAFLLYDRGMKEHPLLYLLLTGFLVGAAYCPVLASESLAPPAASILLSLLCPVLFLFFQGARKPG